MSKELEALENLTDDFFIETKRSNGEDMTINISDTEEFAIIKTALQRLEAIDNANPSEALECLEKVKHYEVENHYKEGWNIILYEEMQEELDIIKQALIKAQEQEKVLELIKSKDRFYDNNTKCKIEIEADDFNSSEEWEQVKEVLEK